MMRVAESRPGGPGADMRYLLLIYSEEATAAPPQDETDAVRAEWWAYDEAVRKAGVHLAGRRCRARRPRRRCA